MADDLLAEVKAAGVITKPLTVGVVDQRASVAAPGFTSSTLGTIGMKSVGRTGYSWSNIGGLL